MLLELLEVAHNGETSLMPSVAGLIDENCDKVRGRTTADFCRGARVRQHVSSLSSRALVSIGTTDDRLFQAFHACWCGEVCQLRTASTATAPRLSCKPEREMQSLQIINVTLAISGKQHVGRRPLTAEQHVGCTRNM